MLLDAYKGIYNTVWIMHCTMYIDGYKSYHVLDDPHAVNDELEAGHGVRQAC